MATTGTETASGTLGELYLLADEVQAALDELLDHSKINYNDINRRNSGVVFVGWNPHCWEELDGAGQRALGEARRLHKLWRELAGKAIATGAPERAKQFESADGTHDHVLRHVSGARAGAPASTIEGTRQKVAEALAKQRAVLADLPTAHGDGGRMLVPDTNALLYQPAIEDWRPDGDAWTAVIFPQVVRELDELKVSGRGIADVAGSCIRRLKEYGGRGDTFSGVPLGPGSRLREVAIDADMTTALSWLRVGNNDDELLASVFELKWQDLSADVVVVTRDRNLQNKARFARVPYLDVEEIAAPRAKAPPIREAHAEQEARHRLAGALPFARSKLGVPPASTSTKADRQSWTLQATPLKVGSDFARKVLSSEAPSWFSDRVSGLFVEPVPVSRPASAPEAGARGFAVRREFVLPHRGAVALVADAGGIVGARYSIELDGEDARALLLHVVEDEYLQPLARTCADALAELGVRGQALIELWAIGLSRFALMTAGHAQLRGQRDGWFNDSIHHVGGELSIPTSDEDVSTLVEGWGRELARAAGIPAWES